MTVSIVFGAIVFVLIVATAYFAERRIGRRRTVPDINRRIARRAYVTPDVDLASLVMRFHDANRTTAQIEKFLEPYIGKWAVYTGWAARVSQNAIYFENRTPSSPGRVAAYFREAFFEQLALVPQGELVAVEGKVRAIDSMFVTLDECEFYESPHTKD